MINYFQKDIVQGKLKGEIQGNPEDVEKIREVDDKLIGDDLDVEQLEPVKQEKSSGSQNEENNY
ncbi:MAG: hypothetical protein H7Z13_13400 [Ferruginibacter sp.]|nr:hypothetical protein [Ferruginibacter sp.]